MTTIAYRDGIMAADSCATFGEMHAGYAYKLARVRGHVIGFAGNFGSFEPFCKWYADGADPGEWPADMGTLNIIVATREGVLCYDGRHAFTLEDDFHAAGSGYPAAMAAMHMGATAKEAVRIAAKVDVFTGGPIRTLKCPEVG